VSQQSSATRGARLRAEIEAMSGTVDRLTEQSRAKYSNPYADLTWPDSVDPVNEWFSSPELLSLAGTPLMETLDERQRRTLAFQEAANFFSLNIHGEKSLMEGLAKRMYRSDLVDISDYLHHFLDEENKHSVYFGGFCRRYAKLYRSRHVAFRESADRAVTDFLFFTKALIFEEHADRYNVIQGRDERLHPLARFINQAHHADETRHLVFNRAIVNALWQADSPEWDDQQRADIRAHLSQFLVTTWREYYNPDVYAECGLDDPWQVAEDAWQHPHQRQHRRTMSAKCLRFFLSHGILEEEPADAF
jgi:hypothetical protein